MKKNHHPGFTLIEVGIAVIIILVLGFIGWRVYDTRQNTIENNQRVADSMKEQIEAKKSELKKSQEVAEQQNATTQQTTANPTTSATPNSNTTTTTSPTTTPNQTTPTTPTSTPSSPNTTPTTTTSPTSNPPKSTPLTLANCPHATTATAWVAVEKANVYRYWNLASGVIETKLFKTQLSGTCYDMNGLWFQYDLRPYPDSRLIRGEDMSLTYPLGY